MSDMSGAKVSEEGRGHQLPAPPTPPPESKPINNTRLRRFLVLASIKIMKRLRRHPSSVLFLSRNLCVKYGPIRTLSEASAMQFIGQHTSIPVPRIICSFTRKDSTYIVMERIHGEMIGRGWVFRTPESQAKILSQVKEMVAEMRTLTPTNAAVSNVDGGILFDGRIHGPIQFGPFRDIQEFHKYLRGGIEAHVDNPDDLKRLRAWQDGPWSMPVYTHGDLSSLNILARGDKVVGIVDWETAGWYPHYWEYTTASQVNPQNMFWEQEIDKFLEPLPDELAMERIRQKYFGDF